jgi:DNA polymerase-3 subunit delta'
MGNDNLPLYHINWKDALVLKSRALSEEALFGILKEIRTSLEYLDRNANITLLLESMITKILYFQAGCVRSIHLEN